MSVVACGELFDGGALLNALHGRHQGVGAVVSFVGYVRDYNEAHAVHGLFLEHYPGMTEKTFAAIEAEARTRWPLFAVEIVHRVGLLLPSAPIVFVGVSSAHRQAAFEACAFIMDYLKTRARFGRKSTTALRSTGLRRAPAISTPRSVGVGKPNGGLRFF